MTITTDAGQLVDDVVTTDLGPTKAAEPEQLIRTLTFVGDVVVEDNLEIGFGDEVTLVITARVSDVRVRDGYVFRDVARLAHTLTVTNVHTLDGDDVRISDKTEADLSNEAMKRELDRRVNASLREQGIDPDTAVIVDRPRRRFAWLTGR